MPEVRIDTLSGQRVIIAGERADRPGNGLHVPPAPPLDPADDPFAPGNEDRTPPELYALRVAPATARRTRRAGGCGSCPTATRCSPRTR